MQRSLIAEFEISIIASNQVLPKLTKGRKFEEAQESFAKAKTVTNANTRIVITDCMTSYIAAYATQPTDLKEIVHICNVSLRSGMNLHVERLHGSMLEREKVMRSLKKLETARRILNGYRAYYNLIREHQALDGRTPAEVSGIRNTIGSNKWLELIRKAQQISQSKP
jgi:transposase-like protein